MIELRDFTIGFGDKKLIDKASVSIGAGCLTALIGRNGSGKSTLLRAVAGLNRRYSGKVIVGGLDVSAAPAPRLAKALAFVSTERTRISNLSCRDVVALGRAPYTDWIGRLSNADSEIVDASLEAVGMASYADRTLDRMSDGECQRVMIARALAQTTPVILLDEPTSFLDLPNRYELCRLLGKLAHDHGKTILYSTHELDIALRLSDAIALIDSPKLRCLPVGEMTAAGHIDRLFGLDGLPPVR